MSIISKRIRQLFIVIPILTALLIVFIFLAIWSDRHYTEKMRSTKPGKFLRDIKNEWGSPDREYNLDHTTKAVLYHKGFLGSNFVFILNKKDNRLVRTYLDD